MGHGLWKRSLINRAFAGIGNRLPRRWTDPKKSSLSWSKTEAQLEGYSSSGSVAPKDWVGILGTKRI